MATREVWKAWNTALGEVDSYTLERADDGTVSSYTWPNGAGDPTASGDLTDHRRVSSEFYEAGGADPFRGWDLDLTEVPNLSFHDLTNCTETQALACFSVTGEGALALDMQDGIDAGAGADFSFKFRLADMGFLAPPVCYTYRLQSEDIGKNNLQLVIRGQLLDGAGNTYTPAYTDDNATSLPNRHYVQAYIECDRQMTRFDFGNFYNETIGTAAARCIHLGKIPKRKMADESYLGTMETIAGSDWNASAGSVHQVGFTDSSDYTMEPLPDDVHVDFTFWARRANGDTSANPRYELATVKFVADGWTP